MAFSRGQLVAPIAPCTQLEPWFRRGKAGLVFNRNRTISYIDLKDQMNPKPSSIYYSCHMMVPIGYMGHTLS